MAHHESDREDLFAEATAYAFRIELAVPGRLQPVLIALRDGGGGSIYFTQEDVWHFNEQGQVRRGYADGALYKAERGRLVKLVRERTAEATILRRTDLDESETAARLDDLRNALALLLAMIVAGKVRVLRATDDSTAGLARAAGWIDETLPRLAVARSPRA